MDNIRPQVAQATLTAAGQSTSSVRSRNGRLTLKIAGTFTAAFRLAFSPDEGKTWSQLTVDKDGNSLDLTAAFSGPVYVGAPGLLWHVECASMSSGSADVTLIA